MVFSNNRGKLLLMTIIYEYLFQGQGQWPVGSCSPFLFRTALGTIPVLWRGSGADRQPAASLAMVSEVQEVMWEPVQSLSCSWREETNAEASYLWFQVVMTVSHFFHVSLAFPFFLLSLLTLLIPLCFSVSCSSSFIFSSLSLLRKKSTFRRIRKLS